MQPITYEDLQTFKERSRTVTSIARAANALERIADALEKDDEEESEKGGAK